MRIGILAHVGNGNLGDEATVAALVQNIRARQPDAIICVFSANPGDTERRHGVLALPLHRAARRRTPLRDKSSLRTHHSQVPADRRTSRLDQIKRVIKTIPGAPPLLRGAARAMGHVWNLGPELLLVGRSFHALRRLDRFFVAGGGQLGDYFGGPWGYPFNILKWCILARMAGARVGFVSVGAEPIVSPISKYFLRWALALADYRSFRDRGSRDLIASIGGHADDAVCPDLVHGLRLPASARHEPEAPGNLTVGINPVPFFDSRYWTEQDDQIYQGYVNTLAVFARRLLRDGHRVLFFPTQIYADRPVISDIQRALGPAGTVETEACEVTDFDGLAAALGRMDIVVASRFHGIVFSLGQNKPVLGLSYYRKTEELLADMNQAAYVLPIKGLALDRLCERFQALVADIGTVRDQIRKRQFDHELVLSAQYDVLLRASLPRRQPAGP
jgi:polysaccharide pyruvyl transferase WcaK-like protein